MSGKQVHPLDPARNTGGCSPSFAGQSRIVAFAEIADGGEAYPVGARQMARQLIAECEGRAQTLDAILMRTRD